MNGCGASVCAADIDTCADCLGGEGTPAGGQYSWSPYSDDGGACVEDCSDFTIVPADAPCYQAAGPNNPGGSGPESCPATCRDYGGKCKRCLNHGCSYSTEADVCEDSCFDLPADADCWGGPDGATPSRATCSG